MCSPARLCAAARSINISIQAKHKRGTATVDAEFLKEIEGWRETLARNIALRNPTLSIDEMNDAVQRTIDRIIFLRMAEDRGIEAQDRLKHAAALTPGPSPEKGEGSIYAELLGLFQQADDKYNSGLFDFTADRLTAQLKIDDKVLRPIIADLYFPNPYEFSVMPTEILGNVYEQFLGKVIRLTASHQAKVEEKPEVKKAGGVYYTPSYIVDYIVQHTVGQMIDGKTPRQLQSFRVLDMACGSGSFLLGAYQYLLDYYLKWYLDREPTKTKALTKINDAWRLTTAERKRILLAHIFGVDIDRQAVEVTKLSLLLKVLEGENEQSLQMELFAKERALPNLNANIKCGNSLIGPDYFTDQLMPDPEEHRRVNPFDWQSEFPDAMKAGGFDCVIGNPPYISMLQLDKFQPAAVKPYWKKKYQSAAGAFDIYVLFVERGLELFRSSGYLSYIIPNKFLAAEYAQEFRKWNLNNCRFASLLDFSKVKVWSASVYPVIPIFQKAQPDKDSKIAILFTSTASIDNLRQIVSVPYSQLDKVPDNVWSFITQPGAEILIKALANSKPLEEVAEIFGASTVAEGSEYPELILDKGNISKTSEAARFVVSGSVYRYHNSWLTDEVQFTHKKYTRPLIKLESPMPERRIEQARSPKIIICKVALEPRAFLDVKGEYAGAYTTYVFEKAMSLAFITGILNSRLMNFLYRSLYDALAMGGGYLRFQPPQIRRLPIFSIDISDSKGKAKHDRMIALVEKMQALHPQLPSAKTAAEPRVDSTSD